MKKTIITIMGIVLAFSACTNIDFEEEVKKNISQGEENPFLTRAAGQNQATSWDECERCYLSSNEVVRLPWANSSSGSIPDDVRLDVKQSDGWRILYSNVEFIGYHYEGCIKEPNLNYLLLYNKYTGMLKGFYYVPNVAANNHAFWQLYIPQTNTKLFNFAEDFATPSNNTATNKVIVSNVSTNGIAGGFSIGWNCFMQELSYDPNSLNEVLDISSHALNQTIYDFNGTFDASSEGVITSVSSKSGILSGVASLLGDKAKNALDSMSSSGIVKEILKPAAELAISELIPLGINKLFGSLLSSSTTTKQNLQFSTNGKLTISGVSTQANDGYIAPVMGISLGSLGERLGVWNLTETPKYTIPSSPKLVKIKLIGGTTVFVYKVEASPSMQYVVNPDVDANVNIIYDLVDYAKYDGHNPSFFPYASPSYVYIFQSTENPIFNQTTLYSDGNTTIKTMPVSYTVQAKDLYPNYKSSNGTPACDFVNCDYEFRRAVAFKVAAKIEKGDIQAVSSKTFAPINELKTIGDRAHYWTLSELIQKGYWNPSN